MKQGHDMDLLELDRCRRSNKEHTLINNDLTRRLNELEGLQRVTENSEGDLKNSLNTALGRENSLIQEVELYKQGMCMYISVCMCVYISCVLGCIRLCVVY